MRDKVKCEIKQTYVLDFSGETTIHIYFFDGKFPWNCSIQDIGPLAQIRRVTQTNLLFWVKLSKPALTEHFLQRNIPLKFNGTIGPNFKVSFFFASDH